MASIQDDSYISPTELKSRIVKGGAITITTQMVSLILRTGTMMITARLLAPEAFGLVAMVTAITSFIEIFSDMGLSTASLQRKELTKEQVTNLFWINLVFSIVAGSVVIACARVLVWFYHEPKLLHITMLVGARFPLAGLAIQHRTMLQRNLQFGQIAIVELSSLMTIGLVTIGLALLKLDYWSIVYGMLAGEVVRTCGFWLAYRWKPGLPNRGSGVRSLLIFGGNVTGFNLVNYWAGHMDNVLIGRWWGERELGLYSRAYSLVTLPMTMLRKPINAVMIPALSRMQDDPDALRRTYLKATSTMAFVSMPLMALMAVEAREVVMVFLGSRWLPSSEIFRVLAIAGFVFPVISTRGAVYVALGQANRWFHWEILNTTVRIACFAAGLRAGGIGVAWGYTCAIYIMLLPSMWHCYRFSPIKVREFLSVLVRPGIASLVMALGLSQMEPIMKMSALSELLIFAATGCILYLAAHYTLPGGRSYVAEKFALALNVLRKNEA